MKWNWILLVSIVGNLLALFIAIYSVQRLGGPKAVWYRLTHPEVMSHQVHRKSIFDMLEIDSTAIVMLGNSLTAYCEWSELLENDAIRNRGIPGETIAGIRGRLPGILEKKPSKVFLMIGINDLMYHDADWVIKAYEDLLEKTISRYPNAPLVLQEILPINEQFPSIPTNNNQIKQVNKALATLASKYKLKFLPLYDQFVDETDQLVPSFTQDGVHLTGQAYLVWKNALEPVIKDSPN